jgi:uncharacterized membrane protein (DUF485 family)
MEAGDAQRRWEQIEGSAEFAELAKRRRRLVTILLAVFVVWYGAFLLCAAYARDFMSESISGGFTVAYAFALSLILMTWLVGFVYVRAARSQLDPAAEEIAAEVDR